MNTLLTYHEKDRLNWPEIVEDYYMKSENKLLFIPHKELQGLTPFGDSSSSIFSS